MGTFRKITVLSLVLLSAGLLAIVAGDFSSAVAKAGVNKTLQNLQSSFKGESDAHTRYIAFAQRADQEGYGEVASLFRALARSDEIHMRNHAEVIRKMGAEPEATLAKFPTQSTQQNLEFSANRSESYQADKIYPWFIVQAHAEGNAEAVRTFEDARASEVQHFKLLTTALKNLEHMHGKTRTYYVCTMCGATLEQPSNDMCPPCANAPDAYEKVN